MDPQGTGIYSSKMSFGLGNLDLERWHWKSKFSSYCIPLVALTQVLRTQQCTPVGLELDVFKGNGCSFEVSRLLSFRLDASPPCDRSRRIIPPEPRGQGTLVVTTSTWLCYISCSRDCNILQRRSSLTIFNCLLCKTSVAFLFPPSLGAALSMQNTH